MDLSAAQKSGGQFGGISEAWGHHYMLTNVSISNFLFLARVSSMTESRKRDKGWKEVEKGAGKEFGRKGSSISFASLALVMQSVGLRHRRPHHHVPEWVCESEREEQLKKKVTGNAGRKKSKFSLFVETDSRLWVKNAGWEAQDKHIHVLTHRQQRRRQWQRHRKRDSFSLLPSFSSLWSQRRQKQLQPKTRC